MCGENIYSCMCILAVYVFVPRVCISFVKLWYVWISFVHTIYLRALYLYQVCIWQNVFVSHSRASFVYGYILFMFIILCLSVYCLECKCFLCHMFVWCVCVFVECRILWVVLSHLCKYVCIMYVSYVRFSCVYQQKCEFMLFDCVRIVLLSDFYWCLYYLDVYVVL